MARLHVGLDVGSSGVRAVEIGGGSPATLLRAAQVALPAGAVQNGEVRNPEVVSGALRELWDRGGFKSRQVTMGVGNQRVVVREVTLPALPPKELRDSLPFQVEELIPIPIDQAVLDYEVLDEFEQEGRQMVRLLVVAAQREMVDRLVQTAVGAKLEPVGVDLVPFALVRAVGDAAGLNLRESEVGGEAVIDVGADVTNICVHEQGVPRFVRILPLGGREVTSGVASALGVSEDQAEALKRGGPAEGARPISPDEVRAAMETRVGSLVDEIRSSLDFYQAQSPGARVTRVLVTGGSSKLAGLLDLIRERVRAHVEPGHPFAHVDVRLQMDAQMLADAEPLLAVALGLALAEGAA